jgi:DNA helicase-4
LLVGVITALIGYPLFRRQTRIQQVEALNEYRDDVYQAAYSFNLLQDSSRYVSKIEYDEWREKWGHLKHLLAYERGIDRLQLDFESELRELFSALTSGRTLIAAGNSQYVLERMERYREFFDTVEAHKLTDSQRRAIVTDEKRNLVVAGAGTGKTSTIVGKAGYLIESGLARPDEILLISFARDARDEMDERGRSRLGTELQVKTFHSLGRSIIADVEGSAPSLSELARDNVKLRNAIEGFIQSRASDSTFLDRLNQYFGFHNAPYESIFNFRSMGEYIDYLRSHKIRSLQGEIVKSYEECSIANLLYLNGVKYEYEPYYEVDTTTRERRQYRPDFYLPEHDIYIEHFGIDKNGNTAPFVDRRKYQEEMEWKRQTHRKNRTKLVESLSWWSSEGILLNHLEDRLTSEGVEFNPLQPERVFEHINELGLVTPLSGLLATFLNLYKSSGKTMLELEEESRHLPNSSRYLRFLELFNEIFDEYEASLVDEIDFNDMILKAEEYVRRDLYKLSYKYILVDEFQDISYSRYRLLKSLADQRPDTKIFCVGDDWQSIYRFTGSDISIMTDFDEYFYPSELLSLNRTFRFDDRLCEFSSKFVQKNPNQIKKKMSTEKRADSSAVTLYWSDSNEDPTETILSDLNDQEESASVFIIGRYNHLKPDRLPSWKKAFHNLKIEYVTAHSSKGTEVDYVIVIGLTSLGYSFPSQIVDDPILELVLAKKERVSNAEERRLFYVALTRARKHVYLVASERAPSSFAVEVATGGYEVMVDGQRGVGYGTCPKCITGVILLRQGEYSEFYSCSNFPYCSYRPRKCPRCGIGILVPDSTHYVCTDDKCTFQAKRCPRCEDGFLVERRGYSAFLGCINYPECDYTEPLYQKRRRRRY